MGPSINYNWVVNFANFISFGLLTFSLDTLVLHHQLGQSSRVSSCISSCIFLFLFYTFLLFIFLIFSSVKSGNNKCPLFTMLTKQNLIKILHSELINKKYLSDLLGDPPVMEFQKLCFCKENGLIIMDDPPF